MKFEMERFGIYSILHALSVAKKTHQVISLEDRDLVMKITKFSSEQSKKRGILQRNAPTCRFDALVLIC